MFRSTAPVASNSQPGTAASGTSAMGKAPEQPKGTTKAEIDDLLNSHTEAMERTQTQAIAAIQDMAYTVTRTQSKPVEVNVAPSQVHLTLAEAKKVPKTYVVTRDEEGMFSGIKEEVTEC
jgi:flagellar capping protein FliD